MLLRGDSRGGGQDGGGLRHAWSVKKERSMNSVSRQTMRLDPVDCMNGLKNGMLEI